MKIIESWVLRLAYICTAGSMAVSRSRRGHCHHVSLQLCIFLENGTLRRIYLVCLAATQEWVESEVKGFWENFRVFW